MRGFRSGHGRTWYEFLIRTYSSSDDDATTTTHTAGLAGDVTLWARRHDGSAARDELIRRNLPLARSLAARYRNANEPFDDLVQVASLGLVKAVERFDPDRGRPFAAFAAPTILGELKRHFRDTGWALHVNRGALELSLKVQAAVSRLATASGRSPSVTELAEHLELSTEQVLEGLEAAQAHYADSLDAPVGSGADDGPSTALVEQLGEVEDAYDAVDVRSALEDVLRRLPVAERQALAMRMQDGLKQSEIARRMGCSQMNVSRLLRRAGERVREEMDLSAR